MKDQGFRPVDVKDSNSHDRAQEPNYAGQQPQVIYVQEHPRGAKSKSRPWLWVLGTLVVVAIIAMVVMMYGWMTGVTHSLSSINQTVQQNQTVLNHEQNLLGGIQSQLHQIGLQLQQLDQDVRALLARVLQLLQRK